MRRFWPSLMTMSRGSESVGSAFGVTCAAWTFMLLPLVPWSRPQVQLPWGAVLMGQSASTTGASRWLKFGSGLEPGAGASRIATRYDPWVGLEPREHVGPDG